MTRELHPHHLAGHSLSASSLWKREMEMRASHVVTEQSTFLPLDDPAPAMTGCCLTVEEVTEQGRWDAWLCHPMFLHLGMCFSRLESL